MALRPISLVFWLEIISTTLYHADAFSPVPIKTPQHIRRGHYFNCLQQTVAESSDEVIHENWINRGLLISSFSDGLEKSKEAQDFLMHGLVSALSRECQQSAEEEVTNSVLQSPCCGPDLDALGKLESADSVSAQLDTGIQSWREVLRNMSEEKDLELRVLFIPTAMYALRPDSINTPGKQRQRARADGKQRRNGIVAMLSDLLGRNVSVLAITADLDDNSAKQPEGSSDTSRFPSNAREALNEWRPHLIYIQGGNTFWLWHCIEKGNWKEDLINACTGDDAAVFCGASAGAIIMGEYIETACWKGWDDPRVVPERETYDDWKGVKGMGLVGKASFFPHMTDDWKKTVEENRSNFYSGSEAICITDEEIYCVNGSKKSLEVFRVHQLVE